MVSRTLKCAPTLFASSPQAFTSSSPMKSTTDMVVSMPASTQSLVNLSIASNAASPYLLLQIS